MLVLEALAYVGELSEDRKFLDAELITFELVLDRDTTRGGYGGPKCASRRAESSAKLSPSGEDMSASRPRASDGSAGCISRFPSRWRRR